MLNEHEIKLIELSAALWNGYCSLPLQHDNDKREFLDAMHRIQHLIMIRSIRREMPELFPKFVSVDVEIENIENPSEELNKSIKAALNDIEL